MSIRLSFLGAAGTVTGARFLLESSGRRLLVDCGLFQGLKALRLRNRAPLSFDPEALDAVLLTHAHIDHSGYLPALVKAGYRGPIYCTPATRDLCGLLLPDAGHLQEEEAAYANAHRTSRHDPALPLYTAQDARRSLEQLVPISLATPERLGPFTFTLDRAGHILGAASIKLDLGPRRIVFSGDVGRPHDPLLLPPDPVGRADYLLLESTYGNRRHDLGDPLEALGEILDRTVARRGVLLVPAFAVGRAQLLLHLLAELRARGRFADVPVYLDSPMAVDATEIFLRHQAEHRASPQAIRRLGQSVHYVRTAAESKALSRRPGPHVLVSASGMLTGGRVLHHLKVLGPDPRATILLVGYQSAGTRGEALASGSRELKVFGEYIQVRAEVAQLQSLSAHADHVELIDWLRTATETPRRTFLVHGEPSALDGMRRHLADGLGWPSEIPALGDTVELD